MARQVRVEILADASKYTRGIKDAQRSTERFTDHTRRASSALKAAVGAFSVGVVVNEMRSWVAAARDSNRVASQTATVLKSTHGAAGLTADQFAKLASQISKTSAVDDDLIQSGENIIATFTQIHGDVFRKTTQAAVDMAAAMHHGEVTQEGLQAASIALGKALNDPQRGLLALQRTGVTFSAQQKEQIANFIKHGQVAKAQGVILAEVNKEFGGSAAAAVTPAKQLAVTWGNMQEVLGNLLIPAIDRGAKILNTILGVVDRNRTAFGILFGVLGGGAAIVGTLVVAEKVHKAVTEGVEVAAKALEATQKGLNVVFGVTKVQATAAAVAEGELGVATTAASAGAGRASIAFGALATRLGLLGAAVGAGIYQGTQFDDSLQKLKEHSNPLATALDKLFTITTIGGDKTKEAAKATHANALETAYAAQQTELQRQEMVKTLPAFQTAADKARLNADEVKTLSGRLADLRGQLGQARESMAKTIESYQGLISQSKLTAGEVVKDIRNQVANFKTYARDTQTLIKAGVNPAAIRELSEKGPQYVHALAVGSKQRLGEYKQAWADRQKEIKTSFAASIDAQYQKLVAQIRKMQKQIDSLTGKNIPITASLKLNFSPSFTQKDWVQVRLAAGRMAEGGLITQGTGPRADDVPLWGSKGEFMVNAAATRAYLPYLEWMNAQKMARGGVIGSIDSESRAVNKVEAWGTGRRMDRGINKIMSGFAGPGGSADVNSVARWTAAILGRPGEWAAWARRIMFESGGRWDAVNRTDSNWLAGHPSVGGAQVIRGTFQRWANGYRGVGPFLYGVSINPRANSFAGANYAIHTYGSLAAVDPRIRPIGYDSGGWLPPGLSLSWNGTGRSEPVGVAAGPTVVNIYPAPGMSERRVGQLVVAALDERDRRAAKGKRA